MEGRGMALEFCCHLWSLQQIAAFAGCKTITSAVLVHCLRQKTEDELLEVTQKMVSSSTLLEKQAVHPRNMVPGFIISASVLLPWKNYLGQFLSSQERAVSASGSQCECSFFLFFFFFFFWVTPMLPKTVNNRMNNWTMTPHIYQNLPFPILLSDIFLRN